MEDLPPSGGAGSKTRPPVVGVTSDNQGATRGGVSWTPGAHATTTAVPAPAPVSAAPGRLLGWIKGKPRVTLEALLDTFQVTTGTSAFDASSEVPAATLRLQNGACDSIHGILSTWDPRLVPMAVSRGGGGGYGVTQADVCVGGALFPYLGYLIRSPWTAATWNGIGIDVKPEGLAALRMKCI